MSIRAIFMFSMITVWEALLQMILQLWTRNGICCVLWKILQKRTRNALTERGSKAKTKSREYKTEYARQLALFRAERMEVKRKKAEKYAALMEKKLSEERAV